jgi:hypothetical protein
MDNINEVTDRVGENFEQVKSKLSERTQELQSAVQEFVGDSPLRAVGIAFGVGYLLSGALFSRTTMRVAGLGGRFVLGGLVKQLLAGVGPGIIAAVAGAAAGEQHSGRSSNHPSI